jgi:filamentous hemagglutinin family protein
MRRFWPLAVVCVVTTWTDSALAQRRPIADDTLGNERSIVTPEENLRGRAGERIEGGARRGNNLFHSFREFGIDEGRAVYFDDPGVQNILSRVTGSNVSEIFGRLGVLGDANLFLLNPNGILFGPNASLDVRGAFVGSTANAIQFGEQGFFNVSDPSAPPLLTVQPSAFLFNQIQAGAIENRSVTPLGDDGLGNEVFGLQVSNGQNLVLLGGNIINSGDLNAFGGRVELGSVAGTGAVGFNADGSLSFPDGIARADVVITDGSQIDVASNNRGDISIHARNIDISGGSLLRAGIFAGLGTVDSQAGNIVLNGTGEIQVRQSSLIINNVGTNGIGNAGNIDITAGSLFVTDGASLQALTRGQGNAGNVLIGADNRVLFDNGLAFSTVEPRAVGRGGNVKIEAGSLEVINGAQLQALTAGQGDAGDVIIDAENQVLFDNGDAFSTVEASGVGIGGDIDITAGSLFVTGGASLQALTRGRGNAGDVIIDANRVLLNNGDAFSTVESGAIGRGGNAEIDAGSLEVINGASLQASTFGQGDAGDVIIDAENQVVFDDGNAFSTVGDVNFDGVAIGRGGNVEINANSLEVRNGGQLRASTFGQGDAGDVIIRADDRVVFSGTSINDGLPSAAFSRVGERGIGNGGNVKIDANSLEVRNGARLTANTLGQGDAGNVIIDANGRVVFDNSIAFSTVEASGVGIGGDIDITAGSLFVTGGASLQALTRGRGDAGNVLIDADNRVLFDNGNAFSTVGDVNFNGVAIGNGGNVEIDANSLEVRNGGQLQASTFGQGDAGDVLIDADNRVLFDGTSADGEFPSAAFSTVGDVDFAGVAVGRGGNVEIEAGSLEVTNGAQLQANTLGQGDAGSVLIDAENRVLFDGTSADGNLASAAFSAVGGVNFDGVAVGKGGNVEIEAGSLEVTNGAQLQASTFGQGRAGNVIIDANRVLFDNGNAFSTVGDVNFNGMAIGRGGNIEIDANSLEVRNGAQLQVSTFGQGDAGNVIIDADNRVVFSGTSTDGSPSAAFSTVGLINFNGVAEGKGGDVRITTGSLSVTNSAQLQASTFGQGDAGNVLIDANRVLFDNGNAFSTVGASTFNGVAVGRGGNVEIEAGSLSVIDGAQLQAGTFEEGDAGNVIIDADTVSVEGVGNDRRSSALFTSTFTGATGRAGEVRIDANSVHVADGAVINAETENNFRGGNVIINADTFEAIGGGQVITITSNGRGRAGNVTLNVSDRITLSGSDPTYNNRRRRFGSRVSNQGETSGLFANTSSNSSGQGGTIRLTTGQLDVSDNARVVADSRGSGDAGNVLINADTFEATGGGRVITTTAGSGQAGNITLNATDRITLSGDNRRRASGLFASTGSGSFGRGGTIEITTGELDVSDRARIVADSRGDGVAGDLDITAQSVQLDQGFLTAATDTVDGGSITLRELDFLRLRNGSEISATAGTEGDADGDGGNIAIDADFIVAFPGNNDIEANASAGNGGRVKIDAEGVFGIAERETDTELNDITATSEQGVQGTVNIDVPDTDPSQGLTELPDAPLDASNQIAQTCPSDGNPEALGEFVVTGRGGLPPDPAEIVGGEVVLSQLSTLENNSSSGRETNRQTGPSTAPSSAPSDERSSAKVPLVEAQGWVVDADGKVNLVAETPAVEPHSPNLIPAHCPDS